jgi:addiction module HigA family antidote
LNPSVDRPSTQWGRVQPDPPQTTLANATGVRLTRLNEIAKGKRGITPEAAWMLAGALGTSPEFWLNLQMTYDLVRSRPPVLVKTLPSNGATNGKQR